MITAQVSPSDMRSLTARYRAREGRWIALMAPGGMASHAGAPVQALPGAAIAVAMFQPGEATSPFLYTGRLEHVMCIDGRFELAYGPHLEARIELERLDLVSVPANVLRSFRNVSGEPGRLLVLTQVDASVPDLMGTSGGDAPADLRKSRAADRVPYQKALNREGGVAPEVMKFMASSRGVYPIVVPPNVQGRNAHAPIRGLPGSSLSLVHCAPGDGPQPHAHTDTREVFLCVQGRFSITWGDDNEHSLTLDPLDMVAVPPTVMRIFRNVSDQDGWLMVIIHGADDMADAVKSFPSLAEEVERRFGRAAVEAIERNIRQSFDAVPGSRELRQRAHQN